LEEELNEARQTINEWVRRMGLAKRAYQQLEEQLNSMKVRYIKQLLVFPPSKLFQNKRG
jgi:hypothetical protein